MNWEAISTIAESIGAIAVVFSLLYLAMQVRTQNRESQMAAVHEIIAAFRGMQTPLQDPGLAKLWEKAVLDFGTLKGSERIQIYAVVGPMLRIWEEAYLQYKSGRLDQEAWEMMNAQYRDLLSMKAYPEFWKKRKHVYAERFRDYVDSVEPGEDRFIGLYETSDSNPPPNKSLEPDG